MPSAERGAVVPLAVGAAGLVALAGWQAGPVRGGMENDLTARTRAALHDAGLAGVHVRFSGRDGVLALPQGTDADTAVRTARSVDGVRAVAVTPRTTVAPTPTPTTPSPSATPTPTPTRTPTPTPSPTSSEQPNTETLRDGIADVERLSFATGSSRLPAGGRAAVARLAGTLRDQPGLRLRIEGHTDDVGAAAMNRRLGHARAGALRAALVSVGVEASGLTISSAGESRPRARGTSAESRALNRRVEITVLTSD